MPVWKTSTKDIKIDSLYGDIELSNNDIKLTKTSVEILRDTVIERYKTNLGDFQLDIAYGANLDRFIGSGISATLVENLISSFRYSLTYDNFVDSSNLEIIPIVYDNSIQLYTYIDTGASKIDVSVFYSEGGFEIA